MKNGIKIVKNFIKAKKALDDTPEGKDILLILESLEKSSEGKVINYGLGSKKYIQIYSKIDFGYYRKEKKLDNLAKEIHPELGITINHHSSPDDSWSVSYLTFKVGLNIEESILEAKKLIPNLKVKWTEEKEL